MVWKLYEASFSHESFVLLVEHGFVLAPCVRSDELHRTSTVPPTKAPLTKDPTAFLGGYLFRPDRRDQDVKEQDANNFASVAKALFKPFVTFNEFFCQACVEATFPHLF